jgi:ribonuclease BN (tRNA processing enzyme)
MRSKFVSQEFKYTFRLRSGSHYDRPRNVTIEAGQKFSTDVDLVKLYGAERWELIDQEGQESMEDLRARIKALEAQIPVVEVQQEEGDDLDRKSVKELRQLAAEMEPPVDLTTCNGKSEIVNAIRQAMDAA